ncbi:hypothetical protein NDU88_004704 [Pleurodeles waltl]|uniref:Uncharacterized protein n=1 Tax=Pleurodeles waltl TaxID=8319 RepID=A0AAV7MYA2_PLEWA|nr:hypothetical protein NDU88_004704 [Pleurodeles waltl]
MDRSGIHTPHQIASRDPTPEPPPLFTVPPPSPSGIQAVVAQSSQSQEPPEELHSRTAIMVGGLATPSLRCHDHHLTGISRNILDDLIRSYFPMFWLDQEQEQATLACFPQFD